MYLFAILVVCGVLSSSFASIPEPTGFGSVACKKWPKFELQDYNPSSKSTYLQTYGLGDMQPTADVTIVGLYFADSEASQEAITFQERMGYTLQSQHKLSVHNVAINYYAPMQCALIDCENEYTFGLFKSKLKKDCATYLGGCAPGDSRTEVDNWQAKLYNVTNMPVLQDTYWVDAWERFGGGEGDIFIFDSEGRLYAVWCAAAHEDYMECDGVYKDGGLLTEASYKDVKAAAIKAGQSDSAARCGEFDDYYYSGYKDTYYYYYYGDDAEYDDGYYYDDTSVVAGTDGADTGSESEVTVSHEDADDDDDDDLDDDFEYKHSAFHLGYRTEVEIKKKLAEMKLKKSQGSIPIAAYASVLAVSVLLVSVVVIYVRWNKAKAMMVMASRAHSGSTRFSRLSTSEDQAAFRDMLREDETSYGSL